ncbi:putative Ig domain-containing protein, partial [Luteolibacter ambystomatis]
MKPTTETSHTIPVVLRRAALLLLGVTGLHAAPLPNDLKLTITADGGTQTLNLHKRTARTADAVIYKWSSAGGYEVITPEARTYRGTVTENPNAIVLASIDGNNKLRVRCIDMAWGHNFRWQVDGMDVSSQLATPDTNPAPMPAQTVAQPINGSTGPAKIGPKVPTGTAANGVPYGSIVEFELGMDMTVAAYNGAGGTIDNVLAKYELDALVFEMMMIRDVFVRVVTPTIVVRTENFYPADPGTPGLGDYANTWKSAPLATARWDTVWGSQGISANGGVGKSQAGAAGGALYHETTHQWGASHLVYQCDTMGGNKPSLGPITTDKMLVNGRKSAIDRGDLPVAAPYTDPVAPHTYVDVARTPKDTAVMIDVLANDHDSNGDTLVIDSCSTTTVPGGTVEIVGNQLRYTPPAGYVGKDMIAYTVRDSSPMGLKTRDAVHVEVASPGLMVSYQMEETSGTSVGNGVPGGVPGDLNGANFATDRVTSPLGHGIRVNGFPNDDDIENANWSGMLVGSGSLSPVPLVNNRHATPFELEFNRHGGHYDILDGDYSFATWFRSDSYTGTDFPGGFDMAYIASRWWHPETSVGWDIYAMNGTVGMHYRIFDGASGIQSFSAPYNLIPGRWYHFASVFDRAANQIRLYVNGQVVATKNNAFTSNGMIFNGRAPLALGCFSRDKYCYDDVRIYSKALNTSEVQGLVAQVGGSAPEFFEETMQYSVFAGQAWSQSLWNLVWSGDAASLNFEILDGPSWLSVNASGILSGTPGAGDVGPNTVTVKISNNNGDSDTATIQVDVRDILSDTKAEWKLNEGSGSTTIDSSGNGKNGTLMNAASWSSGFSGNGITLNGANQSVQVPTLNFSSNTATMSAWVKRNGTQADWAGVFFERGNATGLNLKSNGELRYHWNGAASSYNFASGLVIPDNTWTYCAVVVEPTKATFYMQPAGGAMQSVVNSVAHSSHTFNATAYIGQDSLGGRFFKGSLDEVRVYSRALTAQQIGQVYASGVWSHAPVFTSNPITKPAAAEDSAYSATIAGSATDQDAGDSLSYSKFSGPAWLSVAADGTLSGTPTVSDIGANTFTVKAWDVGGAIATATLNISVTSVNDAPVWTSATITKPDATQGSAYSGSLAGDASDEESGATLSFSKVSGPAWLSVGTNGALSGTPAISDFGTNSFAVRVTDAGGATADATLQVTVNLPSGNGTWTNAAGGSWFNAGNWSGSTIASGADKTANFSTLNLTANATVTLDGGWTIGNLVFGDTTPSNNWTLNAGSGGSLTLDVTSGTPTMTVNNQTAAVNVGLAGTKGLAKAGAGTLSLSGVSTYTGTTSIAAGTLALSGGTNRLPIATTVNFSGNGILALGGTSQTLGKLTFSNGITGTISGGNLSDTSDLYIGDATSGAASGTRSLNLTGVVATAPNVYVGYENNGDGLTGTGVLTLNGGSLAASSMNMGYAYYPGGANAPAANGTVNLTNGAALKIGTLNLLSSNWNSQYTSMAATVNLNGGSILSAQNIKKGSIAGSGAQTLAFNWNDGTIANFDASTDLTIAANIPITLANTGAHTFNISSGRAATVNSVLSGTGGTLTKTGTGTLTLTGANTYTGATTVTGGTLAGTGSLASPTTVQGGGTLAPGANGVGNFTVNNSVTLADSSSIHCEISNWTGTAGTGWDKLTANSLSITASSSNPVEIRLSEVALANFTEASTSFVLATTTSGITGFSADKFIINTSGLTTPQGTWAIQQSGNNLVLAYTRYNTVPAFTADPMSTPAVAEDAAYSSTLAGRVTDPDAGESLSYSKLSGPAWLAVSANGDLTGTPSNSDVGANSFIVRVTDSLGATDDATLNIAVTNTNDAPAFTANPITGAGATEDSAYSGSIASYGADVDVGDTLTYSKVSGPAWLSVASNGALSGTPDNSSVGANAFTVKVTDAAGANATTVLNITVANTNDAPTFTANPIAGSGATEDSAYSGSLASYGADVDVGDTLTYSKVSGPSWLSVASDGALSGTPLNGDVGANSFTVKVTDAAGLNATTTLNITVTNTNDAPAFTANPITGAGATEDSAYSGSIASYGADIDAGDTLTYSKVGGPSWLSVASNGALSGTPDNSNVGANAFTVKVTDAAGANATTALNITVANTNDAPTFATTLTAPDATSGMPYTGSSIAGSASDVDAGDTLAYSKVSGPSWLVVASNGTLTGTPGLADGGTANVFTVRATDGTGAYAETTLTINVIIPDLAADPDGDGSPTGLEFTVGTAPFDVASVPGSIYTNLRGWWKLDETSGTNADDATGRVQDGTIAGSPASTTGIVGNALNLDGTDDGITLGAAPSLSGTGDFTVGAWVKIAPGSGTGVIIQQRDATGSGYNGEYGLQVLSNGTVEFYIYNNGYQFDIVTPSTYGLVNDNQWHHVAATRSGTTGTVYVDGNPLATASGTAKSLVSTITMSIGWDQRDNNRRFKGLLDEVRLYTRALSASELNGLHDGLIANRAPAFTASSFTMGNATVGSAYSGSLVGKATDADTDVLTFAKVSGPSWLTIASNGTLSGTPAAGDAGAGSYSVSVTDPDGQSATATMNITVYGVLPSGWTAGDIGSTGIAGSSGYTSGTGLYTISGAGSDIWGTADAFQYASTAMTGDGEIRARVTSQTNTGGWAKAGVMMRDTTAAGSAHAMMVVTPSNGFANQYRATTGASSSHIAGPALNAYPNNWVRVTRCGSLFTTYVSSNGTTWTQVGQETVTMGTTIRVGLAVDATSTTTASTATFDNVTVTPYPSPWVTGDIGTTGVAGRSEFFNNVHTLNGAGVVGGTADGFRYTYQALTADGDI